MTDEAAHRILVTGAAGVLGSAVVRHLATLPGVEAVVATDRVPVDVFGTVVGVRRDIRHGLGDVMEQHRIDTVIHHAFMVQPSRDAGWARAVNVEATALLVEAASASGVGRIVYPSSTTVYGAHAGEGFHDEDDRPRPEPGFAYSEHKVEAEHVLRNARRSGGPSVQILRCCIVLAPGSPNYITSSLSLPLIPVIAGADPEMQFLHVDDYVTAVDAALGAGRAGTWNVAGRGTLRWRELVRLAGSRRVTVPDPVLKWVVDTTWRWRLQSRSTAAGLALVRHPWLVSTARIERELGWTPEYSSRRAAEAWRSSLQVH